MIWTCDYKRKACRNSHGCHCAEIEALHERQARLCSELRRSTDSLANLIDELSDPGTEALAALHTGRTALRKLSK
jgi:hypothetical protein